GPCGIEKAFIASIMVEGEFLGSVYAYSFIEEEVSPEARKKARERMEALGLDGVLFDQAVSRLRVTSERDRCYFFELVDLVAQEIVTFHTEISKREERINDLNSQLGNRYSYNA